MTPLVRSLICAIGVAAAGCVVRAGGGVAFPARGAEPGQGPSVDAELEAGGKAGGGELGVGLGFHARENGDQWFKLGLVTVRYRHDVAQLGRVVRAYLGVGAGVGTALEADDGGGDASALDAAAWTAFGEVGLRFDISRRFAVGLAVRDTSLGYFEGGFSNELGMIASIAVPIEATGRREPPGAPRSVPRAPSGLGGRFGIGGGIAVGGDTVAQGGVELAITRGWGRHEVAIAASVDSLADGRNDGDPQRAFVADLRYRMYGGDAVRLYAGLGVGGGAAGIAAHRVAVLALVGEVGVARVDDNVTLSLGVRDLGLIAESGANILQVVAAIQVTP
jgi:hypothetical protein